MNLTKWDIKQIADEKQNLNQCLIHLFNYNQLTDITCYNIAGNVKASLLSKL